jgi:hypothetical protein
MRRQGADRRLTPGNPRSLRVEEDWTTPRLVEMVITPDRHTLGRCEGQPSFSAFLGSSDDVVKNVHGVAKVAELDGDEVGCAVGRIAAEIKRQRWPNSSSSEVQIDSERHYYDDTFPAFAVAAFGE